ncbi:MAG: helix-turn-helix domain-containing protein [Rikenellaceae bacterium]|nr:helix-turn-helix domain-containing protein [Rikenellaceae bacterium]
MREDVIIIQKLDLLLSKTENIQSTLTSLANSKVINEEDTLYNMHETMAFLRLCERSVRNLTTAGEITGVKFGSRRFYRKSELKSYLEKQSKLTSLKSKNSNHGK